MSNPYRPLEKRLGYKFRRRRRLEIALTHPSYRYETDGVEDDNQRLEFLGDAVLGLVSAAFLFDKHKDLQEGALTQIRSRLANTKTLARIAASVELGDYLKLGYGERKSGGHQRRSNLSDAMEAVIGAAYIDGGLRAVEKIFARVFVPVIDSFEDDQQVDNPKGSLQEYCQRQWKVSPRYRIVNEEGPAHSRTFSIEVAVLGEVKGCGKGSNKREAETAAAREALARLSDDRAP